MCNNNVKKRIKGRVISNQKISDNYFLMEIESSFLALYSLPGQFLNVQVTSSCVLDPLLRIPLGIHRITKQGVFLLYKVVGVATTLLSGKKKNDVLDVVGPLGNGFCINKESEKKNIIFVAGGHGVVPLVAFAEQLQKKNKKGVFFIGGKTKQDILCVDFIKELGWQICVSTEDGSFGYKGFIVDCLREYYKKESNFCSKIIYSCGPKPMLKSLAKYTMDFNIDLHVSVDEYMVCGIGACLGCAIKTIDGYKYVCKDGPVFNAKEILWDEIL